MAESCAQSSDRLARYQRERGPSGAQNVRCKEGLMFLHENRNWERNWDNDPTEVTTARTWKLTPIKMRWGQWLGHEDATKCSSHTSLQVWWNTRSCIVLPFHLTPRFLSAGTSGARGWWELCSAQSSSGCYLCIQFRNDVVHRLLTLQNSHSTWRE